ncbi:hypothetical protein [Mucilaginibacter sp.]
MKRRILFFVLFLVGCQSKTRQNTIHISLVDNGKILKIAGLDYAIMQEINRDTTTNIWQNLIQIYRMPTDSDLKDFQPIQPGKYVIKNSSLIFSPDTPFALHQTYFVRYYQYDKGSTAWDYIKNNQKPGKKQYIDLIFKP